MSAPVRLVLDEMYSPRIADDLCERGVDAVAVCGHDVLAGLSDDRVLEWATAERRCLVTENVRDFERIRAAWVDQQRVAAGLIYLSARRFPRTPGATKQIVDAISKAAATEHVPPAGGVVWLA